MGPSHRIWFAGGFRVAFLVLVFDCGFLVFLRVQLLGFIWMIFATVYIAFVSRYYVVLVMCYSLYYS